MNDPATIAAHLSDPANAVRADAFQWDSSGLQRPGLYSWWVDDDGAAVLAASLGEPVPLLIYAGQTGADSARLGKRSTANLKSRIYGNHLNGTAYGSTFRKTLSALLLEPLGLHVLSPDRLQPEDRQRVSQWMMDHLSLVVYPYDDRGTLRSVEEAVLRILNPPLNLDGMAPTPARRRITELRRQVSRPVPRPDTPKPTEPRSRAMRFMVPTAGPESWQALLAEPERHWVVGRSARTLAHCWESADGWPGDVAALLDSRSRLRGFRPIYGFPELKTPLPGGHRASQTDLLVVASDGRDTMTVGVEGKVDETFGPLVSDWLGEDPSPGKRTRLAFLADLLGLDPEGLDGLRYQLIHRSAAAKIEAGRVGSSVVLMLVHSWGPAHEGFFDFSTFANSLGADSGVGEVHYSEAADLWLGWVVGDATFLES